ncbi:MAG: hypothetical protein C0402_07940 [Thermodesulfovibrio sp.]|nr:hypothetical protein [Thermodesulfovibrio sp.]
MIALEERIRQARSGEPEDLWQLLKDPHPEVLINVLFNRNFTGDMAVLLAKSRNIPPETLALLATDRRFKDSYKLKFQICRNPRTPQRVVFSLLKFIRIFDLSDIAKDLNVQINLRQKIEGMLAERIRSMPAGMQKALARRANAAILMALMEYGDESVVRICLENPLLTEGHVCGLINRTAVSPAVIRLLAADRKWTLRYYVRYALIRSLHAPLVHVVKFITGMKTTDLRDLYADPKLPLATRPFIFRELQERAEIVGLNSEEIHHLPEEDEDLLSEDDYKV